MNLDMVDRKFSSRRVRLHLTKWVVIITIETEKNVSSLFMRRFRGCQLSWHIKLPNIYEGVIDASVTKNARVKA